MYMTGDVAVRTLRTSAALVFGALIFGCDREPSAPNDAAIPAQPPVLRVARARVIEPGDVRIPNAPDTWSAAGIADPLNTAFDADGERLLTFESSTNELVEMLAGPGELANRQLLIRIDAGSLGLRDPQGLTVDPASGRLFVLDGGTQLIRIEPHSVRGLAGAIVSTIDLARAGLPRLRGIAFDPSSGNLHALDGRAQALYEIEQTGRVVASRDLSEFGLLDPQGMTFGPTGDPTDDESEMGLYLAAGGRLLELSVGEPIMAATATATAALVRTTATSAYSPPSPDPSGLAYATHLGNLVIVDGEVEEMSIYRGANVFETTRSGTLSRSWTTTSYSIEPVGAAYNQDNRHLFISDDDAREVFEIDPGTDGRYGTTDDRRTSIDTRVFGCEDPEGVAYDAANRVLYIADGVGAEVWRVSAGSNGIFDGVAPAGDDQVTHWDTQVHGLLDPEGIAYDTDFGHLYVVGKPANLVFHLSTTGTLLRTVDISAADASKPAGLEYAPGSATPGARNLYIVDRRTDNDSNPNENDGGLYELSVPPLSGNTLPTVTITAPADGSTFTQGNAITFTGTASDAEDGNLTGAIAWTSSVNGSIGSGGSVTTSTLSVGEHTITASVTDAGGASRSATIAVTVNPTGAAFVQLRVAAGTDDAEESTAGTMDLASSDLELVNDGTAGDQLVGLRFNGVAIPRGATISSAYVQFQVDETNSAAAALTIRGQATDNATTFASGAGKISLRSRTASGVAWSPVAWTVIGQAGAGQRTPNIASVIQEIVNRTGWRSGNSLAIIINGTGKRTAESFEGLAAAAPLLRVDYSTGPNLAPSATNVTISGTTQVGRVLTGNYTYNDTEGDAEGASTYRWLRDGTPISGATARSYTLVAADQGTLIRFEVTPVAASGTSPGTTAQSPAVGPIAAAPPNSAPTATNVTISGTAQVGRVLTGNYTYADPDGDMEGASTYRWMRSGVEITGATARSYTLVEADQGATIRFEVTPVAATGASPGAPVQSSTVGPVAPANNAPVASNVTITGTAQVGQVLTGSYTYSDSEGDLEGASTYRWMRAGAPITGATAQTYTLVAADEGALIRFEVRPVAATGTSPGTAVLSPAVGPVAGTTPSNGVVQVRISTRNDDVEESATGTVSTGSSDLELVNDGSAGDQLVGLRFPALTIPRGATITAAYVQFQVDAATSTVTSLTIRGEAADNAVTFNGTTAKVSTRTRTLSAVSWSPPSWTVVGQAGAGQQTPSLTAIIQEIVNRPGWTSGNALAIIINGTGKRTAASFDGLPAGAPLLRVEYTP